ncbi:MAG: ABC transporter permease [Draconibacterium sp.]|nr:ABC transporter permease [Draconibacterium sp.]
MGVSTSYIGLGNGEGQMGRRYVFNEKEESVIEYPVDPDFLNVMDIKLVAGRNFNREIASDSVNSVIVNEALVQKFWGIGPEAAIGKEFKGKGENAGKTIIGVSKNINFEDLTRTVRPQMFLNTANFKPSVIFVRISPGDPSPALAVLNKAWRTLSPDFPFQYNFVDQKFDDFYKSEKRWASIIIWAGGISIFLACMGLIGLISLAVVNRSIEIGVRKVNGARVSEVITMLNSDFVKWVAIGFVIATPIAYYAMNKWLENFAYKTELSWWIFALAGVLALGIALLTVSWQSWKAATRNPVEALRYE